MMDWENKIIAHLDGELSSEEEANLLLKIEESNEIKELFLSYQQFKSSLDNTRQEKPTSQLSNKFYAHLEEIQSENNNMNTSARVFTIKPLLKYAAAFIVLFATGLTLYNNFQLTPNEDHMAINQILSDMESKSDTEKIKALYVNNNISNDNQNRIKEILIQSLKNDASSNVRLASVETLSDYVDDELVRTALIRSLGTEEDPQVQVAIIMALSASNNLEVIKPLEKIINKEGGFKFVKDEAHVGIMNLTSM